MEQTQDLLDCGHPESEHSECTRGFGTDREGRRHCYDCCQKQDLQTIAESKPGEQFFAYLGEEGRSVTNWPGRPLMRVVGRFKRSWPGAFGYHGPNGLIVDWVRAMDEQGRIWSGMAPYGTGGYVRLTLRKHSR
jgi:hypothetical protein